MPTGRKGAKSERKRAGEGRYVFLGHNEKHIKNFHRGTAEATRDDSRAKSSYRKRLSVHLPFPRERRENAGYAERRNY